MIIHHGLTVYIIDSDFLRTGSE